MACSGHSSSGSAQNPRPTIVAISPSSLPAGSASGSISVNGTGFLTTSTVTFNGITHSATYVSASQLTISLSATDLATAGNYQVVVTNPPPGGGSSDGLSFSVLMPNSLVTYTDPLFNDIVPANWAVSSQTLPSGGPNDAVRTVSFSIPTDQIPLLYVIVLTCSLKSLPLKTRVLS